MPTVITSTDLWGDATGQVLECGKPMPFFVVSEDETDNVTIDGTRKSGIHAGRAVYVSGFDSDYNPEVRMTYDSAVTRIAKFVGVTAHDSWKDDKVAVYGDGVVKVTLEYGGEKPYSNTVQAGGFLWPTYSGRFKSATTGGTGPYSVVAAKAIQSAAAGDEFLVKLL